MLKKKPSFSTLLFLISFGAFCAVLFTPALPQISQFYHISNNTTQLVISIYLLGYAVGQLPYGVLGNRIGRKKALIVGISLQIFGTIICLLSVFLKYFSLLVLGRFIMAVGACSGLVMTFVLIGDFYNEQQTKKIISYLCVTFAAMPGVSVFIGGYLVSYFGWVSCFYFLLFYGIFLLFLIKDLPKKQANNIIDNMTFIGIFQSLSRLLKNKSLVFYSLILGCATACDYLFSAQAPFIAIDHIGLSPEIYGVFNSMPVVGMVFGSLVSAYVSDKLNAHASIFMGLIIAALSSILMLFLFLNNVINAWSLFIPTALLFIGITLIYISISATITSSVNDKSNGVAIMSFINLSLSAIIVYMSNVYHNLFILPYAYVLLAGIMLGLYKIMQSLNFLTTTQTSRYF